MASYYNSYYCRMGNESKPEEQDNNQKQLEQLIERSQCMIEGDETLKQFAENKRITSIENASKILQTLLQKAIDQQGHFNKNLVFDFLSHCLEIIKSYQVQLQSGYYALAVFPKLIYQKKISLKIASVLSDHLLLKKLEELALTIDPQLPLQEKGKTITSEYGNKFICLILELLVFLGNKFPKTSKNKITSFKVTLNKLQKNNVVLPKKDKLTIIEQLKSQENEKKENSSPHNTKTNTPKKEQEEKEKEPKYVIQLSEMVDYVDQLIELLSENEDPRDASYEISRYHHRMVSVLSCLQRIEDQIRFYTPYLQSTYYSLSNFFYKQKQYFYEKIQKKQDYETYKAKILQEYRSDLKNISENRKKHMLNDKPPKKQKQILLIEQLQTKTLLNLQNFLHRQLFEGTNYPWEALPRLPSYIDKYVGSIPIGQRNKGQTIGSVHVDENVVIGQGTVLQHGTMIKGPAIIGKNCQFRKGSYVRGNVIVGDNCIIGNSCQLKICHFNYVGDSILAPRAHMAAGAILSNLKLDCKKVKVRFESKVINTGLDKFGAFIGEHAQIGCNAVLNPGSIIGKESFVYPCVNFRGYLPPNSIVKLQQNQEIVEMRK